MPKKPQAGPAHVPASSQRTGTGRAAALAGWLLVGAAVATSLTACWSADGPDEASPSAPRGSQLVGGTVSGLTGTGLVLQNNAGDDLTVNASGGFTFATAVASGAAYAVTVKTQPSVPAQKCIVASGTGVVAAAAITNVTVTCAALVPRFAYAATTTTQLSIFSVDAATGALTAAGSAPTGANSQFMELSADNRFIYWNESTTNTLGAASVNASTGALTAVAGSPFPAGGSLPRNFALAAGGKFLLSTNSASDTVSVNTVNATTGALTSTAGSPVTTGDQPAFVATTPDGKFAYVMNVTSNNISAYAVDAGTGALTQVAGSPFAVGSAISLTIEPRGKFLYVPIQSGLLQIFAFAIDGSTGALTPVPGSPFAGLSGSRYAVADPAGKYLYVSANGANAIQGWAIDASTGVLTQLAGSPFASDAGPSYVAMDPGGKFILVGSSTAPPRIHTIDPATGALTMGASTGVQIGGGSIKFLAQ